jgi:hypothetical protein
MTSHNWVCGVFPNGHGFALKQLFTGDRELYFSEAYVTHDGSIKRAEVIEAPELVRDPGQLAFTVRLESTLGLSEIECENLQTNWHPLSSWKASGAHGLSSGYVHDAPILMSQSTTRFEWDGVTGFGMCELSG